MVHAHGVSPKITMGDVGASGFGFDMWTGTSSAGSSFSLVVTASAEDSAKRPRRLLRPSGLPIQVWAVRA